MNITDWCGAIAVPLAVVQFIPQAVRVVREPAERLHAVSAITWFTLAVTESLWLVYNVGRGNGAGIVAASAIVPVCWFTAVLLLVRRSKHRRSVGKIPGNDGLPC